MFTKKVPEEKETLADEAAETPEEQMAEEKKINVKGDLKKASKDVKKMSKAERMAKIAKAEAIKK